MSGLTWPIGEEVATSSARDAARANAGRADRKLAATKLDTPINGRICLASPVRGRLILPTWGVGLGIARGEIVVLGRI